MPVTFMRCVTKSVTVLLMAALVSGSLGRGQCFGMMVPAERSAVADGPSDDLKTVQTALQNKIIQSHLEKLGLKPEEAKARLARLSDEQIHQVALRINKVAPAGDSGGVALVAVAVVLFIVLIAYLLRTAKDDHDEEKVEQNSATGTAPAGNAAPANNVNGTRESPSTVIVK